MGGAAGVVEGIAPYLPVNNREPKTYSSRIIESYDRERLIPFGNAFSLIEKENLSKDRLNEAVTSGQIHVYEFNGQKYLDRLDIGRVYHNPLESPRGLQIQRYFSTEGGDPFESVGPYREVTLHIDKGENGRFHMEKALFPASW